MSKTYVLDASAVLDVMEDGPGAERVQQLFEDAARNRAPVLMSVMNWGEVHGRRPRSSSVGEYYTKVSC